MQKITNNNIINVALAIKVLDCKNSLLPDKNFCVLYGVEFDTLFLTVFKIFVAFPLYLYI